MPKFPKKLYVAHEEIGTDNEWLSASADVDGFTELSGKRVVAIYVLKETVKVSSTIKMERMK